MLQRDTPVPESAALLAVARMLFCAMDPTKIKARYLIGIILAAVITAAVLRHVLHVTAGFSRKEILAGALIGASIGTFLTVVFLRQRHRP